MSDMDNSVNPMITEWASERAFDELSAGERAAVLNALGSRTEYDRMRFVLCSARTEFSHAVRTTRPAESIVRDLHATLSRRSAVARKSIFPRGSLFAGKSLFARGSFVARMFEARIPAYQAFVGVVAVAAVALLVTGRSIPSAQQITERIVRVQDTVVLTSPASAIDPVSHSTELNSEVIRGKSAESAASAFASPARPSRGIASGMPSLGDRSERRSRLADGGLGAARTSSSSPPTRTVPLHAAIASSEQSEAESRFAGLANVGLRARQQRGVSLSEDTAYRRFTFAVN